MTYPQRNAGSAVVHALPRTLFQALFIALADALAIALLLQAPARAALPDEIQVYVDDLNDPGRLGLQEHINTTPVGDAEPGYPGESLARHGTRFTSEFAYGLTRDLEAGVYLPVVMESGGDVRLAGVKLRLKWVPVKPAGEDAGIFAGLNGELAQVAYRFDDNRRAFELRPMLGWRDAQWLLAVNPVLAFSLQGPDKGHAPGFAPQFKIARTVAPGIATGIEYYTEPGPVTHFEPYSAQKNALFLAVDIDRKPWNVNVGIGRGLTASTDRWTVKLIIDIPLGS
jgi:hypothetical protein